MKHAIAILSLLLASTAAAQTKSALYDEIAQLDRAMFDAFNAHDADKLMSFFSEDLEFYHDKDGLVSWEQANKGFHTMFARNDGIHRELVPGSLEVYPLGTYGAVEIGAHRFCHVENGKDDCGTFKFIQVWRKKDGRWKVTREISYDH